MSEDDFYKTAAVVKLDTLSDVNDIGKPWRYEEDGLTGYPYEPLVSSGVPSRWLWPQTLCRRERQARACRRRREQSGYSGQALPKVHYS